MFKFKNHPFFIKYDDFIKDEAFILNLFLKEIGLLPIIGPLVPTFGGYLHKLRFYEKHRRITIKEIRSNAIKELNRQETSLDKIYDFHIKRKSLSNNLILNAFFEIFMPTSYEIDLFSEMFSLKFISKIF